MRRKIRVKWNDVPQGGLFWPLNSRGHGRPFVKPDGIRSVRGGEVYGVQIGTGESLTQADESFFFFSESSVYIEH